MASTMTKLQMRMRLCLQPTAITLAPVLAAIDEVQAQSGHIETVHSYTDRTS